METINTLGRFQCACCETWSKVYAFPVECDDCHDHFCVDCIVTPIEEDETGRHGICVRCAPELQRCDRCSQWFRPWPGQVPEPMDYTYHVKHFCGDGCKARHLQCEADDKARRASHPVYDGFPLD